MDEKGKKKKQATEGGRGESLKRWGYEKKGKTPYEARV